MTPRVKTAGIFLAVLLLSGAADAQHHAAPQIEKLGTVHFETSCNPPVAATFDRAVALLHSFWFSEAIAGFRDVLEQDASCGMAHWGIAMSGWGNPFAGLKSADSLRAGAAAAAQAKQVGGKTPREQAYIEAVAELYRDYETTDQRTRTLGYERAMERLSAAHPDDPEAATFYALAVTQTATPGDKTYANQLKAAAILERLFADRPDHPGLAHYIIHAYDHPPLADRALPAARRYATIAPSAPHALHMPSHTFTRVGFWDESIAANIASAEAARRAGAIGDELHALDYQVYAYLQTGRDADARQVRDQLAKRGGSIDPMATGTAAPGAAAVFALAAIPARYALERGAWAEAAALEARPSPFAWADAVTHYARALGAARSGNPSAAKTDIARLASLEESLEKGKDLYWAGQVDIQRQVATAWVAFAEGNRIGAIEQLSAAADLEDATDKAAVTPGPLAPAREQLGEMLLAMERPADALVAFEAMMKKEPNRLRGIYGAARAAEASDSRDKARGYYTHLLEVAGSPNASDRAELREARQFLGR